WPGMGLVFPWRSRCGPRCDHQGSGLPAAPHTAAVRRAPRARLRAAAAIRWGGTLAAVRAGARRRRVCVARPDADRSRSQPGAGSRRLSGLDPVPPDRRPLCRGLAPPQALVLLRRRGDPGAVAAAQRAVLLADSEMEASVGGARCACLAAAAVGDPG